MEPSALILTLLTGGLLGMLGQSIRSVVGLRKMAARDETYDTNRMLISLIIGFTAGALGILVLQYQQQNLDKIEFKDILLLITIGYSGVDFIEGFYRSFLERSNITPPKSDTIDEGAASEAPTHTHSESHFVSENGQAVQVTFGSRARPDTVSVYALNVIKELLKSSNNYTATITSTARTPKDQARAMYHNLVGPPENVAAQRALYGSNGDQVIDVFVQEKAAGKSKEEILNAMENKIVDLGPRNVSKHCADYRKLVVVDIAPSSIKNKSAFIDAFNTDERISRFFYPPKHQERAYHVEIPNVAVEVMV